MELAILPAIIIIIAIVFIYAFYKSIGDVRKVLTHRPTFKWVKRKAKVKTEDEKAKSTDWRNITLMIISLIALIMTFAAMLLAASILGIFGGGGEAS